MLLLSLVLRNKFHYWPSPDGFAECDLAHFSTVRIEARTGIAIQGQYKFRNG